MDCRLPQFPTNPAIQGICNDLMMLLCSYASNTKEADAALQVIVRLLSALPYVLFSGNLLGGDKSFFDHTHNILENEEYSQLLHVVEGDRPYVMMEWIIKAGLEGDNKKLFKENLPFFFVGAVQSLRSTFASLEDSLVDSILPFPFVNLMLLNLIVTSSILPIVFYSRLGMWHTLTGC